MFTLTNLMLWQLRKQRKKKYYKSALNFCPQKKALCLKFYIKTPKKPNSARRKVARGLLLSTKKKVTFAITGPSSPLQLFSNVLLRGGRRRDTPGVKYVPIRGVFDFSSIVWKRKARSKFGAMLWR